MIKIMLLFSWLEIFINKSFDLYDRGNSFEY